MSVLTTAEDPVQAVVPSVLLRGVEVHGLSESEVIRRVLDSLKVRQGGWIITLNLQHLYRCESDESYRCLVEEADLVVVDGMPLVWASRLQGTPVPHRVAGSDLVSSLTEAAAEEGRSVFLLGGAGGSAAGAARTLLARNPMLEIAGLHVPPFGFERNPEEMQRIREALDQARPDIIYVALGSPKQERLILQLKDDYPQSWWIGVGISFSFLAGDVKRAPLWVQRLGLEWVHRLIQEPRRLFRRYLIEGIPFGIRLLSSSLATRRRVPRQSV